MNMADYRGRCVTLAMGLLLWWFTVVHSASVRVNEPKGCNIEPQDANLLLDCDITQSNINAILYEMKQPQFSEIYIDVSQEFRYFQFGDEVFHPNLKSLRISGNAFSIARDTFRGLSKLEFLYLGMYFNLDGTLYKDMVNGLSNTTTYPLNINYTAPLFAFGFLEPLTNLRLLQIRQTNISSFHVEEFCSLPQLQTLYLSFNRINSTDELGIICNSSSCTSCLPDVTVLDISGNPISEFTANVSRNVPSLKALNISHCHLSVLYVDFVSSESIQLLDATNNKLHSLLLDTEDLCYSPHLLQLQLENNQLHTISPNLFLCMQQLQYLSLSRNALSEETMIHSGLNSLAKLKWLGMSHNSLNKLQPALIGNMTELLGFWCRDCNLTTIDPNTFIHMKSLTNLDLSNNNLYTTEKGPFSHFLNLQELNLSGNALNEISLSENLFSLTNLDLSDNKLSEIPDFSGSWLNLIYLRADKNHITHIGPKQISGLVNLTYLSLAFNNIEFIPDFTFVNQNVLEFLILSSNRIKTISNYGLHTLPSLTYLDLDNNSLVELPPMNRYSLNELMFLNLSRNFIKTMNVVNSRNTATSLRGIDLSHNHISQIKVSLDIFELLQYMNFSYNSLGKLEQVYFVTKTLPRPKVYLQGNPLHVDCHSEWLLDTKLDKMYGEIRNDWRKKYGVRRNITTSSDLYTNKLDKMIRTSHYVKIPDLDLVECMKSTGERKSFSEISTDDLLCKYATICSTTFCEDAPLLASFCYPGCTCFIGTNMTAMNFMNCSARNMTSLPSKGPKYIRTLYLNGNYLTSINSSSFSFRVLLKLDVSNSHISHIQPGALSNMKVLQILHLQQNSIEKISNNTFIHLVNLQELYLQGNKIHQIDNGSFDELVQLRVLWLHGNNLKYLHPSLFLRMYSLMEITLHGNPWSCDCQSGPAFKEWLIHSEAVANHSRIYCNNTVSSDLAYDTEADVTINNITNRTSSLDHQAVIDIQFTTCMNRSVIERVYHHTVHIKSITEVVSLAAVVTVLAIVLLAIYKTRLLLRVWFYNKFGVRFRKEEDDNDDKPYDLFIAYAKADERLVMYEFLPKLEECGMSYKVCLECRDWPPGAATTDSVVASVQLSKRTIVLVSPNHLDTQWCEYSFDAAHYQVLKDKQIRLILVLTDIQLEARMTRAMKLYMKTNTFLVIGEKWFWKKLRYYLADNPRGADYIVGREFGLMKVY